MHWQTRQRPVPAALTTRVHGRPTANAVHDDIVVVTVVALPRQHRSRPLPFPVSSPRCLLFSLITDDLFRPQHLTTRADRVPVSTIHDNVPVIIDAFPIPPHLRHRPSPFPLPVSTLPLDMRLAPVIPRSLPHPPLLTSSTHRLMANNDGDVVVAALIASRANRGTCQYTYPFLLWASIHPTRFQPIPQSAQVHPGQCTATT